MFGFYITRKNWKAVAEDWQIYWRAEVDKVTRLRAEVDVAASRLERIAAQETPSANATVKRMAAIARGERTS